MTNPFDSSCLKSKTHNHLTRSNKNECLQRSISHLQIQGIQIQRMKCMKYFKQKLNALTLVNSSITAQKMKFSNKDITEEILNVKIHFLLSVSRMSKTLVLIVESNQ